MARKHNYFRVNPDTRTLETARLRRRTARNGGWSTNRTVALRRARNPLQEELGRIRSLNRDGLRRLAVKRDIADRRNKGREWLVEALCDDLAA